MRTDDQRLETGIDPLDRELGGGVPAGHVVALVAPADTQSELLVRQLAGDRRTLYLSSTRPWREVAVDIERTPGASGGDVVIEDARPGTLLASPDRVLDGVDRPNVVVDPTNLLERHDPDSYLELLSRLKRHVAEAGGFCLLHCLESDADLLRELTLHRADQVWRLDRSVDAGQVTTRLFVQKYRGGEALTDAIRIRLTDAVRIDHSREIA
jgi:KaiC/GvpD/RAD55 family RecA-like ATPase